jgi:hypothetical protein
MDEAILKQMLAGGRRTIETLQGWMPPWSTYEDAKRLYQRLK